jgi:acetylornithine deacetylase/succinyl-diaminopimelate desuccinylase-like protein
LSTLTDEVLGRIDDLREEIAGLCLQLGNVYGPVGAERATAEAVHAWYEQHGMRSELVELSPGRANVVARIPGSDPGRTALLFNAHLDTEASGPDYDNLMQVPDPNKVGARREGDRLFGHTVLNDRGCMALFMIAGRVLREAAAPLGADILLTSVAGETGQAPVDEYRGLQYEGKGFGSSYLVSHGVRADYALVAETTDYAMCWYNTGAAYYKVTLRGQNMYTPRLRRPADEADLAGHPNAIVKAAAVVTAVERWARRFELQRSQDTPCGPVVPKAQVGAIRGGIPWRPNRSSPYAALYIDVRTLPGEDIRKVSASLREAVAEAGVPFELDLIMFKPGIEGQGVGPLTDAISAAHERVFGSPPPRAAEAPVVSMWRDTNIFNAAGIPALTYGPSRGSAAVQGTGFFELDQLVAAAKIYALTALDLAGTPGLR